MWPWKRGGGMGQGALSRAAVDPVPDTRGNAGEYQLLYKYLRDRYANRIVLTFAEIEDLLGFALPAPARLQSDWWSTDKVAQRSAQSDSWTLASRTARVNLSAQHVVCERQGSEGGTGLQVACRALPNGFSHDPMALPSDPLFTCGHGRRSCEKAYGNIRY